MNILHILDSNTWGGIEQYVYDVCNQQHALGNNTFVICGKNAKNLIERYKKVAEVCNVDLDSFFGLFELAKIIRFVKKNKIYILNVHTGKMQYIALLLKIFFSIKVVMFKHNASRLKFDVYHVWQRRQIDAFVCVSKLVYCLQVEGLNENERDKFHLVYNGIDVNRFNKYKNEKIGGNNTFDLGFAGRMIEGKGVDLILDAFYMLSKQHDNMRLHFAGSIDSEWAQKFVVKKVNDLGLADKVKFWGLVYDMEKFYKSLNVFVFPSLFKESFGLVLCEALYCGIPVITSNSGAQSEIIIDEIYGELVASNNVDELAQAIEKLYNKKEILSGYADQRKDYIYKKFNIECNVKQIENIFR